MRRRTEVFAAFAVTLTLPLAWAQQPAATGQQMAQPATTPAAAPAATPGAKTFSQQDLDTILAPIALYQDALLAQIFMASTYPLEIVEAARWSAANQGVKDKALEDAMAKQSWDPSVKSLTSVPTVLKQMNDKLDWTQKLGDAFLAQQKDVMDTVQSLRSKAAQNGNLKSTPEQNVKTEKEGDKTVYIVESAKPDVVYVPTYNPSVVYGTWWYPSYPPYYMYPPGYVYAPGLAFATGVVVGAAIWGNCNWGRGDVNINVNKYNNFNRTNISNNNNNWNHNSDHRKGVSYRDQGTAQKYNRGGNQAATQSREQFRGRTESAGLGADSRGNVGGQGGQGGQRLSASDRSGGSGSFGGGDRAGGGGGNLGGGDRAGGGGGNFGGGGASASSHSRGSGGGGFSSGGGGASTRAASSRGSMSRGGGGHGGGRGGGGRR